MNGPIKTRRDDLKAVMKYIFEEYKDEYPSVRIEGTKLIITAFDLYNDEVQFIIHDDAHHMKPSKVSKQYL